MTEDSPLFTVFTPTFDRAHTLHRVYESLRAQTLRDFEWLVVDDGSTDGTAELVARWRDEADFPVRYLYQANAGKHMAFNRGVSRARGTLFLALDSDDECVPEALARFAHHWEAVPPAVRAGFSAVTALCADPAGRVVGSRFPYDPTDSDPLEIRYRYKVEGEKWGFHRTDVLRRFPFPEMPGQAFVTESLVWNRIARAFKTRYVNEVLRVYHEEDAADSLSVRERDAVAVAPMFALRDRTVLDDETDWFRFAPAAFLKAGANYARYSWHEGTPFGEQRRALRRTRAKALHALGAPLGAVLHLRDLRSRRQRPR